MEILEQSKIVHLDEKALLNSFLFWLLQLQITGMILIADRIYDALKVKRFFTMLCISATSIQMHDVSESINVILSTPSYSLKMKFQMDKGGYGPGPELDRRICVDMIHVWT